MATKIERLIDQALDHQEQSRQILDYIVKGLPRGHRESCNPQPGQYWEAVVLDYMTLAPVRVATLINCGRFWGPLPGDPHGEPITPDLVIPIHEAGADQ